MILISAVEAEHGIATFAFDALAIGDFGVNDRVAVRAGTEAHSWVELHIPGNLVLSQLFVQRDVAHNIADEVFRRQNAAVARHTLKQNSVAFDQLREVSIPTHPAERVAT